MDREQLDLAISLVDLTDLDDDSDPEAVAELCERAVRFGTAAVCIWPDFVSTARSVLSADVDGAPAVATVVNFPSGEERPFSVGIQTERALADGADEIDVVLPYRRFAGGDLVRPAAVLDAVRSLTEGAALVKVIIESGSLPDTATIEAATRFAIDHGADFVKTSTGKSPVSATTEAVTAMLGELAAADHPVGIKPSGGISTVDDVARYLALAEQAMGPGWVTPRTFRFGASGLLTALAAAADD